jgi:hypothetical protein
MSVIDMIGELVVLTNKLRNKELTQLEVEKKLRSILSKYKCFHYRTTYRSPLTVYYLFECELYDVEVLVEYCDCGRIASIDARVKTPHGYLKVNK